MHALNETLNNNPDSTDIKQYHILVVDDMATNRMLVRTVLNNTDYTILEAENGEQALKTLKEAAGHKDIDITYSSNHINRNPDLILAILDLAVEAGAKKVKSA